MFKNLLILLLSIFLSFSCSNKNNEKVISEPTGEEIAMNIYAEAGVDEIIISAGFGQNQDEMIESMHRISEEVIPYFKKKNKGIFYLGGQTITLKKMFEYIAG
mgnify:CR=1 FL=1